MERVTPEGLHGDRRIEVYTTDKAEARAILTPDLLGRMTALADTLGGGLQAAFYDDQLFIMAPNESDLFEAPSLFTAVAEDSGMVRIAAELRDVLSMIDAMAPDRRAG